MTGGHPLPDRLELQKSQARTGPPHHRGVRSHQKRPGSRGLSPAGGLGRQVPSALQRHLRIGGGGRRPRNSRYFFSRPSEEAFLFSITISMLVCRRTGRTGKIPSRLSHLFKFHQIHTDLSSCLPVQPPCNQYRPVRRSRRLAGPTRRPRDGLEFL